jgi:hypothetical protein
MFLKKLKTVIVRSILLLAFSGGLLGRVGLQPAHAASFIVTNTDDSGPGSLRQALASAMFGDTITFAPELTGQTITLASTLVIDTRLTIDGSGLPSQVTISGGNVAHLEITLLGDLTISSVVISNGYSSDNGGAIYSLGNIQISDSRLENNHAVGNGGAIALFGNAVGVISNSTIIQNQAGFDGGALAADGNGILSLINSTVTQNQAGANGGALATGGNGVIQIVNSTITQNQAASGGGISIDNNSQVEVYNSTSAGNAAEDAAEIVVQSANSSLQLANTLFACAPENTGCYEFISPPGEVNSLLGVGTLQDFGLAGLADNGGPTQTLALLPGSPLIDAGDDLACTGPLVNNLDQRGFSRSQGAHCDMGAYEYEQAGVLYVDQDAGGINNGLSWANAYTDLQDALAAASSGDEIWVAAGTYIPTTGTDRSISFVLKNGVGIYGGFAGTETLLTERNPVTNITILSGDLGAAGDASDNSFHVVTSNNLDNTAIFDGFTVTAGNADFGDDYGGGGMHNEGSSTPQVRNVIFHANLALLGAGMFNDMSHPVLTNVIFDGNISSGSGGGMFNYQSSPTLMNVVFNANAGTETSRGGAMVNDTNSSPHLTNVTFAGNRVTYTGGAMLNADNSNPILENVTFYDNSSMDRGGAIFNWASSPVLRNVTFSGNSAAIGGAIYNDNNSNPSIVNGILYGDPGGEIYNNSGVATVTYSIVQGDYPGTGNLDVDPLLGPLQDNGGFTQTMALLPGSPAIDAGDDANCPASDQRGVSRPQDSHCDIGAYEGKVVFSDVPSGYWSWSFIERLYAAGVTGGCSTNPPAYCPAMVVTRDQMAVFLLRGKHGFSYVPPEATGLFQDVPVDYWSADWIEQLAVEGITAGCNVSPRQYCPTTPVTRDQMAVFLLRVRHGVDYVPPEAIGVFDDVDPDYWAADWIEQLAEEGITSGCSVTPRMFCPTTPVTRDQMAVFLVEAFNLP